MLSNQNKEDGVKQLVKITRMENFRRDCHYVNSITATMVGCSEIHINGSEKGNKPTYLQVRY